MTNQQVADDLNTKYRTKIVDVNSRWLLVWAGKNERLKKIDKARSDAGVSENVKNICEIAMRMIERSDVSYVPTDQNHVDLLNALVVSNIITQSDADGLNEIGTQFMSRAQELNLLGRSPEVGPAHVAQARG